MCELSPDMNRIEPYSLPKVESVWKMAKKEGFGTTTKYRLYSRNSQQTPSGTAFRVLNEWYSVSGTMDMLNSGDSTYHCIPAYSKVSLKFDVIPRSYNVRKKAFVLSLVHNYLSTAAAPITWSKRRRRITEPNSLSWSSRSKATATSPYWANLHHLPRRTWARLMQHHRTSSRNDLSTYARH